LSPSFSEDFPSTEPTFDFDKETIDYSHIAVFILHSDFSIAWINDATEEYFGISREHVLGRNKIKLIDSTIKNTVEDSEAFLEHHKESYQSNSQIESFDCHVLPGDVRDERWLRHISTRIEDGQHAGGRLEFYVDISHLQEHEENLQLFRQFLDQTNDEIYVIDPDTARILDANPTACERLQYDRSELLGKTVPEIEKTLDDLDDWNDHVNQVQREETTLFETEHLTSDGTTYPVELNIVLVELDRQYFVIVARDTSQRKAAQRALRESRAHLQHAQSVADLGSWHLDIRSNELEWSEEVYDLFGLSPDEEMTYEKFLDFVHPDDRDYVNEQWNAALESDPEDPSYDIEHRIIMNGETRWVHERAELIYNDDDEPIEGIGVVQDITERKQRENRIEDLSDTLETIRRVNRRLVRAEDPEDFVPDVTQILSKHNHFSCTFFTLLEKETVQHVCKYDTKLSSETVHKFHTDEYIDEVLDRGVLHIEDVTAPPYQHHFQETTSHEGLALALQHGSNTYGVLTMHYPPGNSPSQDEKILLKDLAKDIAFSIRALKDRSKLEERSRTDSLTGLKNRHYLIKILSDALDRNSENSGEVALLCIDLQRFDRINTSLGYSAGDQALTQCARRIQDVVPEDCLVARQSSDEFKVLLENARVPDEPRALAEKILRKMNESITVDGLSFHVGARVGIAIGSTDMDDPEDLIAHAYEAQRNTGDEPGEQIRFYADQEDQMDSTWSLQLEEDLQDALDNRNLKLHYQPQVSLPNENVRGGEALLRWEHPEKGFIPPPGIIKTSRKIGRLKELGQWILRTACREIKDWNQELDHPRTVSVNVAPAEFLQGSDYLETIDNILAETGMNPSQLEIEITERQAIEDFEYTADILRSLEDRNLNISMDDFGTGYSSMRYLSALPLDVVKIDRSFIVDMDDDPKARRLVQSIVDIAQDLDIEVVAEGVDSSHQKSLLRDFECDFYQGFLYSRPRALEELNSPETSSATRNRKGRTNS
jgi:diguanylate cyclase (GGDEF)-like protein/PAS domain S-box-containing protein